MHNQQLELRPSCACISPVVSFIEYYNSAAKDELFCIKLNFYIAFLASAKMCFEVEGA